MLALTTICWSKGTSAAKPCCTFKAPKPVKYKAPKIPKPAKSPKLPKPPKPPKPAAKVVVPKLSAAEKAALKPVKAKAVKIPKLPKPAKLPKNVIIIPENI